MWEVALVIVSVLAVTHVMTLVVSLWAPLNRRRIPLTMRLLVTMALAIVAFAATVLTATAVWDLAESTCGESIQDSLK